MAGPLAGRLIRRFAVRPILAAGLPDASFVPHGREHVRRHQHMPAKDRQLGVHDQVPLAGGQFPGPETGMSENRLSVL
jgi:hypothetical protein